jgi:Holliday junction resolvasome RuvABC endonuclease subunit
MLDRSTRILGINPGTRYLGYALLNNSELRDWGIKSVKGTWTPEKSKKIGRILLELLDQYHPDVVAIKKLHPARTSPNLHGLVNRFKDICRERNIHVYEYPVKYFEKVVLTNKMNKLKLVEALAELYPALLHEAAKEIAKAENKKCDWRGYHTWMFEAVALGHVCFNQLDNQ